MRNSANAPLLPEDWRVPSVFRERLGATVGRQRLMLANDHLLLITHKPPQPDQDHRAPRMFWRQPSGAWLSSDLGDGSAAVSRHIGEFLDRIDTLEDQEHGASRSDEYFSILEQLGPLHRAIRHLYAVLQEARQAIPEDRDLINLRDQAYELERRSELLYTVTKNGLDYAVARQAEQQSNAAHAMATSAHRLNILVAFFFPLATFSSIFGMSLLDGWKQGPPPTSFLIVVALSVVMGFALHAWIVRNP